MQINVFKEFVAGFFSVFLVFNFILLVVVGAGYKCGFMCAFIEKDTPLLNSVFRAFFLALVLALIYLLWRSFDSSVITFPIFVFSKIFHKELDTVHALKLLISQLMGAMFAIYVAIFIYSLLFLSLTLDSPIYSMVAHSEGTMIGSIQVVSNLLREIFVIPGNNLGIGYVMPYMMLIMAFAIFYDHHERKVLYNSMVVFLFVFLVYLLNGDVFLIFNSFLISLYGKSSTFFGLQSGDFLTTLQYDIASVAGTGFLYFFLAVCGYLIGLLIRREIFELGVVFEEELVQLKSSQRIDPYGEHAVDKKSASTKKQKEVKSRR